MNTNIAEITKARKILATLHEKNEAAIHLLHEWLADDSGYDEKTWPIIEKVIEENRLLNLQVRSEK